MPFIEVKTNQTISDKINLKSALGEAITAIPGILRAVMSLVQCLKLQFSARQAMQHMMT